MQKLRTQQSALQMEASASRVLTVKMLRIHRHGLCWFTAAHIKRNPTSHFDQVPVFQADTSNTDVWDDICASSGHVHWSLDCPVRQFCSCFLPIDLSLWKMLPLQYAIDSYSNTWLRPYFLFPTPCEQGRGILQVKNFNTFVLLCRGTKKPIEIPTSSLCHTPTTHRCRDQWIQHHTAEYSAGIHLNQPCIWREGVLNWILKHDICTSEKKSTESTNSNAISASRLAN